MFKNFKKKSSDAAAAGETQPIKKSLKFQKKKSTEVRKTVDEKTEYNETKRDDNPLDERTQERIQILEDLRGRSSLDAKNNNRVAGSFDAKTNQRRKIKHKIRDGLMFPFRDGEKKKVKKKKVKTKFVVKGETFLLSDRYKVTGKILGAGAYACVCQAFDNRAKKASCDKKEQRCFRAAGRCEEDIEGNKADVSF